MKIHIVPLLILIMSGCTPSIANDTSSQDVAEPVTAIGRIDTYDRARYLSPRRPGVIASIHVAVGDYVSQGQLVAKLECTREQAEANMLAVALETAAAEHEQLKSGARPGVQEQAEADYLAAKHQVSDAKDRFARRNSAKNKPFESEHNLVALRREVSIQEAKSRSAQARLEDLKDGPRAVDLEVSSSRVRLAQARLEQANNEVELCSIYAPVTGEVLALRYRPGEHVSGIGGDYLGVVADTDKLIVRVELEERDLNRLRSGASAVLWFPGDEEMFDGVAYEFSGIMGRQTARSTDPASRFDRDVLEVLVAIDEGDGHSPERKRNLRFAVGRQMFVMFSQEAPLSS